MQHFSKRTLLRKLQGHHLEEIIAAVLQNHAVPAGTLGGIDKVPAFLEGIGGRHLDGIAGTLVLSRALPLQHPPNIASDSRSAAAPRKFLFISYLVIPNHPRLPVK